MKSEWKECTIGDFCSSVSDTYHGNDEKVVLVNTSDVLEGKILNHKSVENKNLKGQFKKTFKKDDILYSEIRPANKRYAYVDFEETKRYIASTKLMVLRPNINLVLPRFLFAFLTSNDVLTELQHLAETRSGTFPQITFSSELASMPISVPCLDEQQKIASISTAVQIFLTAAQEYKGFPFPVNHRTLSAETAEALEDARQHRNLFGPYQSAEEAVAAMLED